MKAKGSPWLLQSFRTTRSEYWVQDSPQGRGEGGPCGAAVVGIKPPFPPTATAGMGVPLGRTWAMARAVALLRVDLTQSSETATVWGLRWHKLPMERNGVQGGAWMGQAG